MWRHQLNWHKIVLKFKEMHKSFQVDVGSITNTVLLIAHLRFTTSASWRLKIKPNMNFISHYMPTQHLMVLQSRAYTCHFKYICNYGHCTSIYSHKPTNLGLWKLKRTGHISFGEEIVLEHQAPASATWFWGRPPRKSMSTVVFCMLTQAAQQSTHQVKAVTIKLQKKMLIRKHCKISESIPKINCFALATFSNSYLSPTQLSVRCLSNAGRLLPD